MEDSRTSQLSSHAQSHVADSAAQSNYAPVRHSGHCTLRVRTMIMRSRTGAGKDRCRPADTLFFDSAHSSACSAVTPRTSRCPRRDVRDNRGDLGHRMVRGHTVTETGVAMSRLRSATRPNGFEAILSQNNQEMVERCAPCSPAERYTSAHRHRMSCRDGRRARALAAKGRAGGAHTIDKPMVDTGVRARVPLFAGWSTIDRLQSLHCRP